MVVRKIPPTSSMLNVVAIVSALHLLSEGVFPVAEGSGEPYGINRQVVEAAARAGSVLGTTAPVGARQFDSHPAPALNQVITAAPGQSGVGEEVTATVLTLQINVTTETTPPATTTLTTQGAQTPPAVMATLPSCNGGRGVERYERLPDTVMDGNPVHADVIRRNSTPVDLLAACEELCLQDKTALGFRNTCTAFDFDHGRKIEYYKNDDLGYTQSRCQLSRPSDRHSTIRLRDEEDKVHFREVCYTESVVRAECATRLYVMERRRNKNFHPIDRFEVEASTLEDCQDKCLNQYADDPLSSRRTCRSGTFDRETRKCYHSGYTLRTHHHLLQNNPNTDYFENTCLTKDRRCPKNKLLFVVAVNYELMGPYDTEVHKDVDLVECQDLCLDSKLIFCRSLEYDKRTRICMLSAEDSASKPHQLRNSTTDSKLYYEVMCIDGENVVGQYTFDTSDTQQLNQRRYSDVRTAFQLYRERRLTLGSGFRGFKEIPSMTLAQCLDECLETRKIVCRSVMHSERYNTCLLSEYDTINGKLEYNPHYNYFENLMENVGVGVNQIAAGSADSPVSMDGDRTSQPDRTTVEAGPGSAGQTGATRPGVGLGGTRPSADQSSGSRSTTEDSFGSDRRPGFFGGRGSGFGDFGGSSSSFGSGFGGNRNRFGEETDRFGGGDRDRFGDDRDRFGVSSDRDRFGSAQDRFGSNRDRFGVDSRDRFGDDSRDRFGSSSSGSRVSSGGSSGSRVSSGGSSGSRGSSSSSGSRVSSEGSSGSRVSSGGSIGSSSSSSGSRNTDDDGTSTSNDQGSQGGFGFFSSNRNNESDRRGVSGGGSSVDRDDDRFRPLGGTRPFGTSVDNRVGTFRPSGSGSSNGNAADVGTVRRTFGTSRESGGPSGEVTQQCTDEGMEFSLRTEDPFRGRIYTYGYYDRCYLRGSGSSVNTLKISGPRSFPDCGTTKYGETMTNIVVVQFSDNVQTSLDKRYNLTCTVVGPGEAVVTSGYIGAGSGAPTPIEYLPAENQLQSRVRLQILYGGRPTTTIAVGDPLTFRLESQRGFNLVSDIFATDVVAKDPYSGRSVDLIDSRGCPVDIYVFPALGKGRDGDGLEARFNAFKIPESNFLIFEATVRTCRRGCQPALCTVGPGREEVESYGRRRRRDASDDDQASPPEDDDDDDDDEEEGQIHGIYEVYLSRDEIGDDPMSLSYVGEMCMAPSQYYSLVIGLAITTLLFVGSLLFVAFCFRKTRQLHEKNAAADAGNPYHSQQGKSAFPGPHPRTLTQPASYFPSGEPTASAPQAEDGAATSSRYPDPSEPIYTDPALFER